MPPISSAAVIGCEKAGSPPQTMKCVPVQTPAADSGVVGAPTEVSARHEFVFGSYTPPPSHGTHPPFSVCSPRPPHATNSRPVHAKASPIAPTFAGGRAMFAQLPDV